MPISSTSRPWAPGAPQSPRGGAATREENPVDAAATLHDEAQAAISHGELGAVAYCLIRARASAAESDRQKLLNGGAALMNVSIAAVSPLNLVVAGTSGAAAAGFALAAQHHRRTQALCREALLAGGHQEMVSAIERTDDPIREDQPTRLVRALDEGGVRVGVLMNRLRRDWAERNPSPAPDGSRLGELKKPLLLFDDSR